MEEGAGGEGGNNRQCYRQKRVELGKDLIKTLKGNF
jgi:hypothetical protein